jgi:hypothetical protein
MPALRQHLLPRHTDRRQGSILLLVIVFLTVLILLATMLAYTSKLEAQSAENAALSIQARMSAVSGVAGARRALAPYAGSPIAYTQDWARAASLFSPPSQLASSVVAPQSATAADKTKDEETTSAEKSVSPGHVEIEDLSARIDLNSVLPYATTPRAASNMPFVSSGVPAQSLEALIALRLAQTGRETSSARAMTQAILDARLGPDRQPGDGLSRPGRGFEEFQSDLRKKPRGDDRPILNLGDAKTLAQMPEDLWQTIEPLLTTFASSPDTWNAPSDAGETPRVSLNSADPRALYETLRKAFPQASSTLLKQFAVNLVDRRDSDSLPTPYKDDLEKLPIIGYEKTVVIGEVCADTITPSRYGDNGEYIEIFNPLDKSVDLTGWTLNWENGETKLGVVLPAGGYLVLTDDIKDSNDPTPERDLVGMGSFYEVFRILPFSSKTLLVEDSDMNIPDDSGMVRLVDPEGRLIDYLTYKDAAFNGINRGFEKLTPFVHQGVAHLATPFDHKMDVPSGPYERYCRDLLDERMNQPFASVAETLAVPALSPDAQGLWLFPSIDSPGSTALGLGVLDCLTEKDKDDSRADTENPGVVLERESILGVSEALTSTGLDALPLALGRINVNTATKPVLSVLPGLDDTLADKIVAYRQRIGAEALATGLERVPFVSLSDFAVNKEVWGDKAPIDRLKSLISLCPLVTTRSSAFVVSSTALIDGRNPTKDTAGLECRAVVHVNGDKTQVLAWEFVPPDKGKSVATENQSTLPTAVETPKGAAWGAGNLKD